MWKNYDQSYKYKSCKAKENEMANCWLREKVENAQKVSTKNSRDRYREARNDISL